MNTVDHGGAADAPEVTLCKQAERWRGGWSAAISCKYLWFSYLTEKTMHLAIPQRVHGMTQGV